MFIQAENGTLWSISRISCIYMKDNRIMASVDDLGYQQTVVIYTCKEDENIELEYDTFVLSLGEDRVIINKPYNIKIFEKYYSH